MATIKNGDPLSLLIFLAFASKGEEVSFIMQVGTGRCGGGHYGGGLYGGGRYGGALQEGVDATAEPPDTQITMDATADIQWFPCMVLLLKHSYITDCSLLCYYQNSVVRYSVGTFAVII